MADGAAATKAPHQVHFAPNINTIGAIALTTPNGTLLQSHVAALAYTDDTTGNSALLGMMQDSSGLLLPPNQILYPNAFAGVPGDVRYTFTKGSFEQEIILRANPPAPEEYGMNPNTTRLEVWTEFVNAADPEIVHTVSAGGMIDNWMEFSEMRMGRGAAFSTDAPSPMRGVAVSKNWVKHDGRSFLVEGVRYRAVQQQLAGLPPLQANARKAKQDRAAFAAAPYAV